MFERFTEAARQVVVKAMEEARALRHQNVGSEHVLLALVQSDGLAGLVLHGDLDINPDKLRAKIVAVCGEGEEATVGQLPLQPQVKRLFDFSLREALSMGHSYVGTEHLLLGLVRDPDSVAYGMLKEETITAEQVRDLVIGHLMSPAYAAVNRLVDSGETTRADDLAHALDRLQETLTIKEDPEAAKTGSRCKQALEVFGAFFVCQHDADVPHDEHVEHGSGWEMRWTL